MKHIPETADEIEPLPDWVTKETEMIEQQAIEREFDVDTLKSKTWLWLIGMVFVLISLLWFGTTHAQTTPTFTCTKTTGESPLATTCNWSVPGASSCTAAGAGAWSGSVPISGSRSFSGVTVKMTLTLSCVAPSTPGKAVLTWTHDLKNTDGTSTLLAGFTVLYGVTATQLTQTVQVNDAAARTFTVDNLATGTWFFAVKARSTTGAESANSNVASKAVTATPGAALPVLSVTLDPIATPSAPVLTVSDPTAMEIRPNSTGTLTAARIGLVPVGTRCYQDSRTASGVTYNGVPIELVDFVNWPTASVLREAWAKCAG